MEGVSSSTQTSLLSRFLRKAITRIAWILPALAIDKSGNRLGQGGGSYDRIKSLVVKFKVAAINEAELVESIPNETHDLKVDAVLTSGGFFNLN